MGAQDRIHISVGANGISVDFPGVFHHLYPSGASPDDLAVARPTAIPLPRAEWREQGGTHAGLVVPRDGGRPYNLVAALVPGAKIAPTRWGKIEEIDFKFSEWDGVANMEAILRADPSNAIANQIKALTIGGHTDWYWPSKLDSAVLYAGIGDLLREFLGTWGAWICAQHPDVPSDASVQDFVNGYQGWGH